jgi:hypothetical protein
MLDYLYCRDYDDSPEVSIDVVKNQGEGPPVVVPQTSLSHLSPLGRACTNVQMHVVADKYMISSLQELSEKKLISNMESEWDKLALAELVRLVYGDQCLSGSKLRELVLKFAIQHSEAFRYCPEFDMVLLEYSDFCLDFARSLMKHTTSKTGVW